MNSKTILVVDEDGGYIKAEFVTEVENADEEHIPIYKQVEYYHDRESALRDC